MLSPSCAIPRLLRSISFISSAGLQTREEARSQCPHLEGLGYAIQIAGSQWSLFLLLIVVCGCRAVRDVVISTFDYLDFSSKLALWILFLSVKLFFRLVSVFLEPIWSMQKKKKKDEEAQRGRGLVCLLVS